MGLRDFVNGLGLGKIASEIGTPRTMPADLQANGIQGTAIVRGMTSSNVGFGAGAGQTNPIVSFELIVTIPDREPYPLTTNQTVPYILTGSILPGSTVFVRVDPTNLGRLGIDFSQIIPNAMGGAVMGGVAMGDVMGAAMAGSIPGGQPMSGDALRESGTAATGVVQQTFSVGNITAPNGDPVLGLIMSITYRGSAPYISKNGQRIPRDKYALVVPGARFPLKGNPAVPDFWTIDWPAVP
jgi:hypothetical protein